jgi:3-hydroxymyristoyl/3-hydroxydecanoyl-(acyl carrier protein) dehydratase
MGHFPGDPIVPGVVILDFVRDLIKQHYPESQIATISQAKFHQPLRPDQPFTITLQKTISAGLKFECFRKADKLTSGKLTIIPLHE